MLALRLDRHKGSPLYRQVASSLAAKIASGELRPGSALPASRDLARLLGVNRSTIVTAYQELAADGLVEARVGRGTKVAANLPRAKQNRRSQAAAEGSLPAPPRWQTALSSGMRTLLQSAEGAPVPGSELAAATYDFSRLYPDETLFPVADLKRAISSVLGKNGDGLLQYGSAFGYPPLRRYLARRMAGHGIRVEEDGIIVLNGAQQGLDLLCKVMLSPGDAVVVESPTYQGILPMLRFYGAQVLAVPMTAAGMDLDTLAHTLDSGPVKLIYTMPNFQNPTGITTDLRHRQRLLDLAAGSRVALIEDGFEEDLRFAGDAIAPLKSLDSSHQVIYLGTFSKGLVPGLRIGWIAADPALVELLAVAKRMTDMHTPTALQAALFEFCRRGFYDRHLQRLQTIYSKRLAAALEALETDLPRGCTFTRPHGGYAIWVQMPEGTSADEVARQARVAGVAVAAGSSFFADAREAGTLRLSISRTDVATIRAGIGILGRTIAQVLRRAARGHAASRTLTILPSI